MWTVCILCTLLGTLVPTSDAISAVITPKYELFVTKGDQITLNCTLLNLNSSTYTSEDIQWYKDNIELPSDLSHAISVDTSQLTVLNSTFDDSGNYGCGFPGDSYFELEQLVVTVALPPAPVQSLACRSYDAWTVHCSWEEGVVDTNTRNVHEAKFKDYGRTTLYPTTKDTDYSCHFEIRNNEKVIVQVTSTNRLGISQKEIVFHTVKQSTPNKPEDVIAEPYSENGDSTLRVAWGPPSGWDIYFYALEYRVRYSSEGSSEMKEKRVTGGFKWTFLENLDPFVTYDIEVSAKSVVAGDEYFGEPGKTEATTLEGSPSGRVSGLIVESDTDSKRTGLRHVELQWQPPPIYQWGSESLRYAVHLIPEDESPDRSMKEYTEEVSVPSVLIHDVSKYQTYSINIKSLNDYGEGPETTFEEKVVDRTSAPGKPAELLVELMDGETLEIAWEPPVNPNGIIHDYEVVVTGDAVFSSNESDVITNDTLTIRTFQQRTYVEFYCTEVTKMGHLVEVKVAATTKNYTNYIFQGDPARFIKDGVCRRQAEPNWIFLGIFIPGITIVICIAFLLLWNYFKDKCVEPPEPYLPSTIKKNGHIGIGNISIDVKPKEEIFDKLNPRKEIGDIDIDITRRQQTPYNLYQNPRNQPKNTLERLNSHDSGMPESPMSDCGHDMAFYNPGFIDGSTDGHHEPIQTISRDTSVDESNGYSSSWRHSGISNGSVDSGAEVALKEDTLNIGPRPTSSSTDELPSPDPYFKLSSLPLSSPSSDLSNPYIKTPPGQDGRMQEENEDNENADELENDCPFDDDDDESNSGYLQQYQLSPTSPTADVPPYMQMTPISPPPVSNCVPNGYVSRESLPSPPKGVTGGFDSVPEEYSTMVDSKGVTEGYLKHDAVPTSQQTPEAPATYIKHTSFPCTDVNYRDNYPDFNHNVPPWPTQVPILGPKQESGIYVQHKDVSISSLSQDRDPPYIPNKSPNSSSSELMPYSKLALNDYKRC